MPHVLTASRPRAEKPAAASSTCAPLCFTEEEVAAMLRTDRLGEETILNPRLVAFLTLTANEYSQKGLSKTAALSLARDELLDKEGIDISRELAMLCARSESARSELTQACLGTKTYSGGMRISQVGRGSPQARTYNMKSKLQETLRKRALAAEKAAGAP